MQELTIKLTEAEAKLVKSAMDSWCQSCAQVYHKYDIAAVTAMENNLSALRKIITAVEGAQ